jgi:hypothetical protein
MRERLIELLGLRLTINVRNQMGSYDTIGERTLNRGDRERLADHLLANGVIVPPVAVGQTVYCIRYDKARKPFVKPLGVLSITAYGKGKFTVFTTKEDLWCVTAFPTKEEAEKALREAQG